METVKDDKGNFMTQTYSCYNASSWWLLFLTFAFTQALKIKPLTVQLLHHCGFPEGR